MKTTMKRVTDRDMATLGEIATLLGRVQSKAEEFDEVDDVALFARISARIQGVKDYIFDKQGPLG